MTESYLTKTLLRDTGSEGPNRSIWTGQVKSSLYSVIAVEKESIRIKSMDDDSASCFLKCQQPRSLLFLWDPVDGILQFAEKPSSDLLNL